MAGLEIDEPTMLDLYMGNEIAPKYMRKVKTVKTGKTYIDNQNNHQIEDDIVLDRQKLATDGIVMLVAQVVGYIKGKSAIYIARTYLGQRKNYGGMSFWARGYFVSTVGTDEEVVRTYIRAQAKEDQRVDQLKLF